MTREPLDQQQPDDEAEIDTLFSGIEERVTPSPEALARAKAQSAVVWQEVVAEQLQKKQAQKKQRYWMALAATCLLAVAAALLLRLETSTTWELELATGELEIQQRLSATSSNTAPRVSIINAGTQEISADTQLLATQNTRIHLASGAELRLAQATRINFIAADRFELVTGRVYIDTHERSDMTVVTAWGEVADIGTQYSVAHAPNGINIAVNIAVRSGSAVLTTPSNRYQANADPTSAGIIEVTNGGIVSQHQEPKSASRWDWIHTTATGYSSHEVSRVLVQIAQDLGVQLQYASVGDQAALANVTYAGDLSKMEPKQALELVALSSGLRWTLDAQTLLVSLR